VKPHLQDIHLCLWTSLAWHASDEARRGTCQADFGEELRDRFVAGAVGAALRSKQLDNAGNRCELIVCRQVSRRPSRRAGFRTSW
jgi:hypothetical protein